jgi:hypothetical protein
MGHARQKQGVLAMLIAHITVLKVSDSDQVRFCRKSPRNMRLREITKKVQKRQSAQLSEVANANFVAKEIFGLTAI